MFWLTPASSHTTLTLRQSHSSWLYCYLFAVHFMYVFIRVCFITRRLFEYAFCSVVTLVRDHVGFVCRACTSMCVRLLCVFGPCRDLGLVLAKGGKPSVFQFIPNDVKLKCVCRRLGVK